MRKKLKTLVEQDFKILKESVLRDNGNVPPILFFHFKDINPEIQKEMNVTMTDDFFDVESGFFVPMTRAAVLENRDVFMGFMATIMASLKHAKMTGDLHSVVIALAGNAVKDTGERADLFIVAGVDHKGETAYKAQEIKSVLGEDTIKTTLVDSEFIGPEVGGAADAFLSHFFKDYNKHVAQLLDDQKNLGILYDSLEKYKGDNVQFVADLIDSAVHATALVDSFKQEM